MEKFQITNLLRFSKKYADNQNIEKFIGLHHEYSLFYVMLKTNKLHDRKMWRVNAPHTRRSSSEHYVLYVVLASTAYCTQCSLMQKNITSSTTTALRTLRSAVVVLAVM
jgi:hypothetical protein